MKRILDERPTHPQKELNTEQKSSPKTGEKVEILPLLPSPKPIPLPRTKVIPPIPLPRTKVTPPIPQPRKKKAAEKPPLNEEEKPPLNEEEKQAAPNHFNDIKELEKEEEEREIRCQENWHELRWKYYKWFLDPDVNIELEETKMLIFNPVSGTDIPVKDYMDIAEYFNSRGYQDFLDEAKFNSTLHQGKIEFLATTNNYEPEEWTRYIFIKDPRYH